MKKIDTKTLLFAFVLFASMLTLSGCNSKKDKENKNATDAVEKVDEAEQRKKIEKRRDAIYDSLMNIPNTINGMSAAQAEEYCWAFLYSYGVNTKHELDSLQSIKMNNILHQKVITAAKPIVKQHVKEICASLASYKLDINIEKFDQINDYGLNSTYINLYGEEISDTTYGVYSFDIESNKKDFVNLILQGVDISKYGTNRQAEIKSIIEQGYVEMMQHLKQNRIAISKKFADYYPSLDLNRFPQKYRKLAKQYIQDPAIYPVEGGYNYEYNNYLPTNFSICKLVRVYDSKLDPRFFNVAGAKYKLVNVSKNKWQVVRTSPNGKVDKTPVFTDNKDYDTVIYERCDKTGNVVFEAEAGANIGVHVFEETCLAAVNAEKPDVVPDPNGARAARIEDLKRKKADVDSLYTFVSNYSENARKQAASWVQQNTL